MPRIRTPRSRTRLVALTTTAACAAGLLLTGCFNAITVTDAGRLGITVDAAGAPVLLVMLCEKGRPYVQLVEGRTKSDLESKANVQRGEWSTDTAYRGVQRLTPADPEAGWTTTESPGALAPDVLLVADGGTAEDDTASLVPVDFTPADLATLRPGQVLTGGKTVSLDSFGRYGCAG